MRFFATKKDLLPIITEVESQTQVRYCATGLFVSSDIIYYTSLSLAPNVGLAQQDTVQSPSHLILPAASAVQVRAIPQRSGEIMYAVDQLLNPETIVIRPGGIYKEGILVEGTLNTAHKSDFAASLAKLFRKEIIRHFKKLDYGCYAGLEAYSLLEQGWRLVQSESQPQEYDQKVK